MANAVPPRRHRVRSVEKAAPPRATTTMIERITLPICNCFLLRGRRPVLVDPGRPKDAPALVAALRARGVGPGDLALVLHTHGHWDHAGSTAHLKTLTAAPAAV